MFRTKFFPAFVVAMAGACSSSVGGGSSAGGGGGSNNGEGGGNGGAGNMPGTPQPAEVGEEFACGKSEKQTPGPTLVRRLTVAEYLTTVRDITGVDISDKAAMLPKDHAHDGFTNDARAQTISLDHVEVFSALATEIVRRLPDKAKFVGNFAACTQLNDECTNGFIDKAGVRILRRPPSDGERAALAKLFTVVKEDGGTFQEGAELVLRSLLQAPRFLYLVEPQRGFDGGTRALDGYEMAQRLSYLFWGAPPDDALFEDAAAGRLEEDEGLNTAVERLVMSDRSRKRGLVFLSNWLELDRLDSFQSDVAADMRAETEAVFDRVVFEENKPLPALFGTQFTLASKALATHYRFDDVKDGVSEYDLSGDPHRRGILTHGSVLSAGGEDASLVNRGLFVLRNFLCSKVPPPPVGVNNGRPDTEPGKPQRYYAEQRTTTSPCSGCHSHLDPLAFALERFSGLGVARDQDEGGNDIDTTGKLRTPYDEGGKDFADPKQFAELLESDPRVSDCMILKTAQFALARAIEGTDACTLAAVKGSLAGDDGPRLMDVLGTLVRQPGFRNIPVEN